MCMVLSFSCSSFLKTYIKYLPKIIYFSLVNLYFCTGIPAINLAKARKVAPSPAHSHTSAAHPCVSELTGLGINVPITNLKKKKKQIWKKKAEPKEERGRVYSILSVHGLEEHRTQVLEDMSADMPKEKQHGSVYTCSIYGVRELQMQSNTIF